MENPENYQVRVNDLTEDTIETKWIPLWNKVNKTNFTRSEAEALLSIGVMPEETCKEIVEKMKGDENEPGVNFAARIISDSMTQRFNIKMSYKLQLWLIYLFKSPGNSVMIFAYTKWKMNQLGINYLDLGDFNIKFFPLGFPSDNDFQWLWECQKLKAETEEEYNKMVGTGNLLDCSNCYKSFI